jgi:hypothetical protein
MKKISPINKKKYKNYKLKNLHIAWIFSRRSLNARLTENVTTRRQLVRYGWLKLDRADRALKNKSNHSSPINQTKKNSRKKQQISEDIKKMKKNSNIN